MHQRPGERERDEHHRPQLRRHGDAEQGPPETVTTAEQRGEGGGREQRRPEVEAREDERADEHRREADVVRGRRPDRRDDRDQADAAGSHQHLERDPVVAEERRDDEDDQRRRRVLDGEVAVGDEPVMDDRVAVRLVDGPVDQLPVRPEPPVHERVADEEQPAGGERDVKLRPAPAQVAHAPPTRPSPRGPEAGRRARGTRTGRTRRGTGSSSRSARPRTTRAASP